jgi:hypothetical protein
VQSKKEWPVLYSIKLEAIKTIRESECPYEGTFICKESTFYEVGRLAVL